MTPVTPAPSSASQSRPAVEPPPVAPPPVLPPEQRPIAELLDEPSAKTWYRRPVTAVVAVAVLCVVGGAWWYLGRKSNDLPVYSTQAVALGNITLLVTANGTLQPTRSINIGSELSGTVLQVNVDVNDMVKKGQVLVVLDTAKLRDQILRSQATLNAAQAKVTQVGATVREAQAALGRFEEVARLSDGKVPSKAELDASRATLERAVADESSARAGVSDAKAAISTDQTNLSKASIPAPADGVVLTRSVDPGNTVAASLQAVTLFTVAESLNKLRLWVYVDEADVGAVNVGQEASFTVSAYPSRSFPARITRVGFGSTITDNVVTYLTYLDVTNADLSLRPGMTATSTIVATHRENVLLVPNTALRFSPTVGAPRPGAEKSITSSLIPRMPGNNTRRSAATSASTALAKQVWVTTADGKGPPVVVPVTPGISDGRMTEITAGELKVGMLVITGQKAAVEK